MRQVRSVLGIIAGVASAAALVAAVPAQGFDGGAGRARHVLVLSVDGLHASDLSYYVVHHPSSALASLVGSGVDYTNAQTTFPSDSFPGMVAQLTGATPGTSGVYYDDTFNHSLLPAGTTKCAGVTPGAEVSLTEAADLSQNPITLDAGQKLADTALTALPTNTLARTLAAKAALTRAILAMTAHPQTLLSPAALPVDPSTCKPITPHGYLKVNTVFEVAAKHGLLTAWSDKHPAYEILNGPSGTGIADLFTPEINSVADAAGDDWTTNNALTQEYDGFKVAAVLNEIAGKDHSGTRTVGTPAIFGMNFQSVSTAEKLPVSGGLTGGYLASGAPGPLLSRALDFTNQEVGAMLAAIRSRGLASTTTVILSAKHGQSPQEGTALRRVDDGAILTAINAAWKLTHPKAAALVSFSVDDDGMLLWLSDRSAAATSFVKHYLLTHSAAANRITDAKGVHSTTVTTSGLSKVYAGAAVGSVFDTRSGDPRVPDVLGIAQHGVVYTGGVKKIAEHGGDGAQDLNVPLVVAGAGVTHGAVRTQTVQTTQIAPTILRLLGLAPDSLQGVRADHTAVLPGL